MRDRTNSPQSEPLKNFEANVVRVTELIEVYELLATGPGKPAQRRADIAAAAIVMTIAAVDGYFDDRLSADFDRYFHRFTADQLGEILNGVLLQGSTKEGTATPPSIVAGALQSKDPKAGIVKHFRQAVSIRTYQEPGVIQAHLSRFEIRNLWGDVNYQWQQKYGERLQTEKAFREWAVRRHDIAHRSGHSKKRGETAVTKARPGLSATREGSQLMLAVLRSPHWAR